MSYSQQLALGPLAIHIISSCGWKNITH